MIGKDPVRRKGAFARAFALPHGSDLPARDWPALWPVLLGLIEDERQARRPFLWLAPFVITGALLYAAADREPSLLVSGAAFLFWTSLAVIFRRGSMMLMHCTIALAMIAAGFLCAGLKTQFIAAPILAQAASGQLDGIIETVDASENDARLIIRPIQFNGRISALPMRVRLKGPHGLHAGDHILASAHLMPPPEQARPGGYEFARDAFFKGIGAVGSLNGPIEKFAPYHDRSVMLGMMIAIDKMRNNIAARIHSVIGGQSGAVAAALITGKRGMINDETNEDLRDAGIYHVVSISGLHMVLAAGMIFFILRLILALVPQIALEWPVKKIAACGAMIGAFAYNLFAGSEVATERSLIMTLFLFGAVLAGRSAISMRNLAFAAIIVVMIEPDSVTGPSFQMSFAAVAALIAIFENRVQIYDPIWQAPVTMSQQNRMPKRGLPTRIMNFILQHSRTILVTTLIAEAATAPYSAFHFQRFQPLGLIGNALSIPLIELVAMPIGFIGLFAMPFGLDAPLWHAMGYGVQSMLVVSHWVAQSPIATQALPAISIPSVMILSFGLVWLALWSSLLRYLGIIPIAIGLCLGFIHTKPDLFIARDGQSLALRMSDGRLHAMGKGASEFMITQWLAADGDLRKADDPSIRSGPICTQTGCIAKLYNGQRVTLTYREVDLNYDCGFADLVITPLTAPDACKAQVIDRSIIERNGAIALTLNTEQLSQQTPEQKINGKNKFILTGARNPNALRPWMNNDANTASDNISDFTDVP